MTCIQFTRAFILWHNNRQSQIWSDRWRWRAAESTFHRLIQEKLKMDRNDRKSSDHLWVLDKYAQWLMCSFHWLLLGHCSSSQQSPTIPLLPGVIVSCSACGWCSFSILDQGFSGRYLYYLDETRPCLRDGIPHFFRWMLTLAMTQLSILQNIIQWSLLYII